jgi:hypothetical protein
MSIDQAIEHYGTRADDNAQRFRRCTNVAREVTCQQSR